MLTTSTIIIRLNVFWRGPGAYFLRWEEVDVKQLPLAVDQRQEGDGHVVVRVEVGARAAIVEAVVLHGHERREVATSVAQGDGALPAETLLPQERQVHAWGGGGDRVCLNSGEGTWCPLVVCACINVSLFCNRTSLTVVLNKERYTLSRFSFTKLKQIQQSEQWLLNLLTSTPPSRFKLTHSSTCCCGGRAAGVFVRRLSAQSAEQTLFIFLLVSWLVSVSLSLWGSGTFKCIHFAAQ